MDYYKIVFKSKALKDLKKLEATFIKNIINNINSLKENPLPRGVKKLQSYHSLYRIRVGDYRVIYEIDKAEKIITIQYVRNRKDAYRF